MLHLHDATLTRATLALLLAILAAATFNFCPDTPFCQQINPENNSMPHRSIAYIQCHLHAMSHKFNATYNAMSLIYNATYMPCHVYTMLLSCYVTYIPCHLQKKFASQKQYPAFRYVGCVLLMLLVHQDIVTETISILKQKLHIQKTAHVLCQTPLISFL